MAVEFDGDRMLKNNHNTNSVHPKRPLCACTSYSCNKLFLFLHSCFFVVIGAGLLLVGAWIELQNKDYESVNKVLFIPALMLMSVGFVIMINSLIGVAGTVRENSCLLKTFLVVTVLAFFTQIAIGVLAFVHRQKVPDLVSNNFMFLVEEYHQNQYYRMAVDHVQVGFHCCGFDSYMDYDNNSQFTCSSTLPQQCGVPWSCCKKPREGGFKVKCGYGTRYNSTMPVDKINTMGCTDVFLTWLSWNLDMVGIVGLGSSIPQIVGILLAYFFIRQVREMKMWYRVGM
ncbi:tetraspanin-15-like [Ruditapes philippinarum]|uniref:tetraspanin-15-like n=1 Tax=Ruditapes philippinarum TaxID=129788 RepID=UPI00295A9B8F|nr:tetraspanin-15-like [Ruditapes philippinarum]